MPKGAIRLTGKLPKLEPADLARIGVFLVQGNNVLGQATPTSGGHFSFSLPRATAERAAGHGLEIVVGPIVIRYCWPIPLPGLPRVALTAEQLANTRDPVVVDLSNIDLSRPVLEIWWGWCRNYCVSGTLVGSDNCPVPYASVTVYTVGIIGGGGYSKVARGTVTADAQGRFTVCFLWCSCEPCWPCWPTWYLCWPWWWERDILAVVEALESRGLTAARSRPGAGGALATAPLATPNARDLMLGRGFAAAGEEQQPDPARAAQVRRKLSDPAIRAIFPWWWWCCENPNIVFSASQGGTVVLDEDPAVATRWCLPADSSVTLVANASAMTNCAGGNKPPSGFFWTKVGSTLVNQITDGYAAGSGDGSDCAFAGALDIYGEFAATPPVWYYQVEAAQWSGDPARPPPSPAPAPAPGAASSIGPLLQIDVLYVDSANMPHFVTVTMGPFNTPTLNNLYATEEQRANVPAAHLPAVPWAPTDQVWFLESGRKVYLSQPPYAEQLIPGLSAGTVSLSVAAYDQNFNSIPLTSNPDDVLTLTIDTTGLNAKINSLNAFTSANQPVTYDLTTACPSIDVGPGGYIVLNVTVTDTEGDLCEYEIVPDWGHGLSGSCTPALRGYETPPGLVPYPPSPYQAPDTGTKSFGGGTENIYFYPLIDCCYDFRLNVSKRVTDGTTYPPQTYTADFWTATISVDPIPGP